MLMGETHLPVGNPRRVVIAYGFKKDFLSFRKHILTQLPEVNQIGFDLVIVLSNDNINYELYVENEFVQSFEINPRFLEFEALHVALIAVSSDYDTYIYFNCSLFSKHILFSARRAILERIEIVERASIPCLSGRMDRVSLRESHTGLPIAHPFVSTFFMIFNKACAETIKILLDNYPQILNSSNKFDFNEFKRLAVYRLRHFNKNYCSSPNCLILLKADSVLVEQLISVYVSEYGKLFPAYSLNSKAIRGLEFVKNFIYKRIPCARRFLSRL